MTYEEMVNELKEQLTDLPNDCSRYMDIALTKADIEKLISAVEKQIPKKPYLLEGKRWLCPNCENTLRFKLDICAVPMNEQKHCMNCGQRLDWSEFE